METQREATATTTWQPIGEIAARLAGQMRLERNRRKPDDIPSVSADICLERNRGIWSFDARLPGGDQAPDQRLAPSVKKGASTLRRPSRDGAAAGQPESIAGEASPNTSPVCSEQPVTALDGKGEAAAAERDRLPPTRPRPVKR